MWSKTYSVFIHQNILPLKRCDAFKAFEAFRLPLFSIDFGCFWSTTWSKALNGPIYCSVLGFFDEDVDVTCTDPALLPLARLGMKVKNSFMFCFVPVSSDGSAEGRNMRVSPEVLGSMALHSDKKMKKWNPKMCHMLFIHCLKLT